MTAYHELFFRTNKGEEQIVRDVSLATGVHLRALNPPVENIVYGGKADGSIIEIEFTHDDRDLDFTSFPGFITIGSLANDKAAEELLARSTFEDLARDDGYHLLLVFDFQRLLART